MTYESERQQVAGAVKVAPLSGKTQQQARDWINDNVTDLPSAKSHMAEMAAMMVILQKEIDMLVARLSEQ